jgi:hypothetical protein
VVVVVVGKRVDSDGKENNVRSVVDTANTNPWQ